MEFHEILESRSPIANNKYTHCYPLQAGIKAYELRNKNKAELYKQLDEFKQELAGLRVQKISGGAASKLQKM